MEAAPHLAFWPGLALTITVYSLNMFGGAVRDLLDPRLRGGTDPYSQGHGPRAVDSVAEEADHRELGNR